MAAATVDYSPTRSEDSRSEDSRSEDSLLVSMREISKGIAASHDAMTFVTDPTVLGDAL